MQDKLPQQLPEPPIVIVSAGSPRLMLALLILSIVVVLGLILYGSFSKRLSGGWRIFVFAAAAGVAYVAATSGPGLMALLLLMFLFAD